MRFKKGNRWKSRKSEIRYKVWRKNVFELNKAKRGLRRYYVCVRNVVKDERQHECSMHIIVRVGIDSPMIDTIGLTEW